MRYNAMIQGKRRTSSFQQVVTPYIPLTRYLRRGTRGISDIPLRHPRFNKIS
jgi:hypothetical protein